MNDYEHEPVPLAARSGPGRFWGMYAGEHIAGTELMIGPLFLAAGVSAIDLFLGLLVGNALAVLSWRYVCAPIAVRSRLTLYEQLDRICGRRLVVVYNTANGVLFCFLAGAMITVAATAVGVPVDLPMPELNDTMPAGIGWVVVVVGLGGLIAVVAAKGYDFVAQVANVAAPWMLVMFIAFGLVAAQRLGVDFDHLGHAAARLWPGGDALPGQRKFGLAHVVFFAWFCNAAMHVGLADLSVLRFARTANCGWASAGGMYLGHMLAWVAASALYAAQLATPAAMAEVAAGRAPAVLPGPMAYDAAGVAGVVCVVVACWTTANPTIYRAGLAFQAVVPGCSRVAATLFAGALATLAGMFPAFAMRLLGFVGIYGTVLAPIGAVIVADLVLARRVGFRDDYARRTGATINMAVLLAWGLSLAGAAWLYWQCDVFPSFLTLPAWVACGVFYVALAWWRDTRRRRGATA